MHGLATLKLDIMSDASWFSEGKVSPCPVAVHLLYQNKIILLATSVFRSDRHPTEVVEKLGEQFEVDSLDGQAWFCMQARMQETFKSTKLCRKRCRAKARASTSWSTSTPNLKRIRYDDHRHDEPLHGHPHDPGIWEAAAQEAAWRDPGIHKM